MSKRRLRERSRVILSGALIRGRGFEAAACRGQWRLWGRGERALRRRGAPAVSSGAVEAMARVCAQCPEDVVALCGRWARQEEYTGWAAGTTWDAGVPGVVLPETRNTPGRRVDGEESRAC